jgi:hypothetical protein
LAYIFVLTRQEKYISAAKLETYAKKSWVLGVSLQTLDRSFENMSENFQTHSIVQEENSMRDLITVEIWMKHFVLRQFSEENN